MKKSIPMHSSALNSHWRNIAVVSISAVIITMGFTLILPYGEIPAAIIATCLFMIGGILIVNTSNVDSRFLKRVFIYSYLIRVAICVFFYWYFVDLANYSYTGPSDSGREYSLALTVSEHIARGQWAILFRALHPLEMLPLGQPTQIGYTTINGILLALLGENQMVLLLFNAFLGAMIPVLLYRIALQIFDVTIAKVAARLSAYFPTLIVFSAMLIKDNLVAFSITLFIWLFIKVGQRRANTRFAPTSLLLMIVILGGLYYVRRQITLYLITGVLFYFLLKREVKIAAMKYIGISTLIISLLWIYFQYGNVFLYRSSTDMTMTGMYRDSTEQSGTIMFALANKPLFIRVPLGTIFALITPFPPWRLARAAIPFYTGIQSPGNLVLYVLIPYMFLGMWYSIKNRSWSAALPGFLIITVLVTIGYLYMGGIYRYRLQITPLMLMFAAVGWVMFKGQAKRFKISYLCSLFGGTFLYVFLRYWG